MINTITLTATEARIKLFEILNAVRYENTEVRILKNNRPMARIIRDDNLATSNTLVADDFYSLAGRLSEKDANSMLKAIKKAKKLPIRNYPIKPFN